MKLIKDALEIERRWQLKDLPQEIKNNSKYELQFNYYFSEDFAPVEVRGRTKTFFGINRRTRYHLGTKALTENKYVKKESIFDLSKIEFADLIEGNKIINFAEVVVYKIPIIDEEISKFAKYIYFKQFYEVDGSKKYIMEIEFNDVNFCESFDVKKYLSNNYPELNDKLIKELFNA